MGRSRPRIGPVVDLTFSTSKAQVCENAGMRQGGDTGASFIAGACEQGSDRRGLNLLLVRRSCWYHDHCSRILTARKPIALCTCLGFFWFPNTESCLTYTVTTELFHPLKGVMLAIDAQTCDCRDGGGHGTCLLNVESPASFVTGCLT